MTNLITTMKRYELKYILTPEQTNDLKEKLISYMRVDDYGLTSIASLYYDTIDSRLIRTSIEKPEYKEKIRLRSYGLAKKDSEVFLELKRKAYGIVYKRRVPITFDQASGFFNNDIDFRDDGQIAREISYFRGFYTKLVPACLIIYDRLAYYADNSDLRLTIDANPRYRTNDLDLSTSMDGISLLPEGYTVLEVKVQDAIPLWLTSILSDLKIYQNSFSKYGEAYARQMSKLQTEVLNYA